MDRGGGGGWGVGGRLMRNGNCSQSNVFVADLYHDAVHLCQPWLTEAARVQVLGAAAGIGGLGTSPRGPI